MSWLSEIVWLCWGLFGLGWELFTAKWEQRYRQEPLTRIVRDRLFRSKVGIVFRLACIAFWGWLALHWLVPLNW